MWGGDSTYHGMPIITLDLTGHFRDKKPGSKYCLGLQIMARSQPFVFMKLQFKLLSGETATVTTDSSWLAFNADAHRRPGPATAGHSAGTGFLEYIDARAEPAGWQHVGYKPSPPPPHPSSHSTCTHTHTHTHTRAHTHAHTRTHTHTHTRTRAPTNASK